MLVLCVSRKRTAALFFSFFFLFLFLFFFFFAHWIKVPFIGIRHQTVLTDTKVKDHQTKCLCFPSMFDHWLRFSIEADYLFIAINQNYELCLRSSILNVILTISLGIYWNANRVWIMFCKKVLDDCFRICTVVESANF